MAARTADMPLVVCLGEVLIDFVSLRSGVDLAHAPGFQRAAGGAPANVAVGIARLGGRAGFVGKVGRDPFGEFLCATLRGFGVDVAGLVFEESALTTLAFVSLTAGGERDFVFYRGADMLLRSDEVDGRVVSAAGLFHFGSVSLSREPCRSTTIAAAEAARRAGCLVSFDINLRPALWAGEAEARQVVADVLPMVDLAKMNDDELAAFAGGVPLPEACRRIRARGPRIVVVTLGRRGCFYQRELDEGFVAGFRVRAIDTTGAGDAFMAAVLCGLARGGVGNVLDGGRDELRRVLRMANAAGALATTRRGAIPALPTRRRLDQLLRSTTRSAIPPGRRARG